MFVDVGKVNFNAQTRNVRYRNHGHNAHGTVHQVVHGPKSKIRAQPTVVLVSCIEHAKNQGG